MSLDEDISGEEDPITQELDVESMKQLNRNIWGARWRLVKTHLSYLFDFDYSNLEIDGEFKEQLHNESTWERDLKFSKIYLELSNYFVLKKDQKKVDKYLDEHKNYLKSSLIKRESIEKVNS